MPEVTWAKEKWGGWGQHDTHMQKSHTHTQSQTPWSITLSSPSFQNTSTHTHWISSHFFSWREPPMAAAVGIHSPRMLGQLCWYWMRRSWFCLSLHAARDKNYMLLNSNLYRTHAKMRPAHLVFVFTTKETALDFIWENCCKFAPADARWAPVSRWRWMQKTYSPDRRLNLYFSVKTAHLKLWMLLDWGLMSLLMQAETRDQVSMRNK